MTIPLRRKDIEQLVEAFAPGPPLRVLELGFGKGVNARLFHERGDFYTGCDRQADALRPEYAKCGQFFKADYCQAIPEGPFDLIFDRASFVYNGDEALSRALKLVHGALIPGGLLIAADLYTEGNYHLKLAPLRTFTVEGAAALFEPLFETVHLADTKARHRIDYVGRKPL